MKNLTSLIAGAAALATVALANPAQAAVLSPVLNSQGSPSCSGVTISPDYDDCAGFFDGNPSQQEQDALDTLNDKWGSGWSFLTGSKVDVPGISGEYFNLSYTVPGDGDAGTLTFKDTFDQYQTGYDVVLSFKAGSEFAFYKWDSDVNLASISWDTPDGPGQINGDNQKAALSNASIFVRKNGTKVPEPMGLLGTVALGVGAAIRRRNQSA